MPYSRMGALDLPSLARLTLRYHRIRRRGTGSIGRMVRRVGSSGIAPLHGGSRAVSSSQGSHGCGLLHAAACSTLRVVYVNTARSDRERTAHSRKVADNGYARDLSALLDRVH